jgi:UDP-glucose 4-epimerase
VDALVEAGHEVTVFDRFSHDAIVAPPAGVRVVRGDLADGQTVRRVLEGQDLVAHLASSTAPIDADSDPSLEVRTNLAHTVDLLAAAADAGVRRVVFASSGGAIYGDQDRSPVSEDAVPRPLSPYAIGKLAIEGYLRYFRVTRGLASVSLRISNPYGPRQHPHKRQGVIPIFLHRIAQGLPVEVFGDGSMVRDYLYVSDAARMVAAVMDSEPRREVYNVGSGHGASVAELVAACREVTGRPVEVESAPAPSAFVDRIVLDVSRFAQEFGIAASVPLREGIERTWRSMSGDSGY